MQPSSQRHLFICSLLASGSLLFGLNLHAQTQKPNAAVLVDKQAIPHNSALQKKPLMNPKPSGFSTGNVTTLAAPAKADIPLILKKATLFREWPNSKVPQGKTDKTFLSILNEPPKNKVSDIVFIAAGQQAPDPRNLQDTINGYPNVLTGQYRHYKAACANKLQCAAKIKYASLASRVFRNVQRFPHDSTLIVLVFDSQFNHMVSENNKRKMENAYWSLLTNRANAGNLKSISLIGQSKGGCLSFSLAKRLRNHSSYQHIPTIVQGYDPVCTKDRLLASGAKQYLDNPLKSHPRYKSLKIDMDRVFPSNGRDNLAILNIHSGAPVISLGQNIGFVHSFTFKPNDVDLGWWKQTWVGFEHTDMGGNLSHANSTVIPGYKHLLKYTQQFSNYQASGNNANHQRYKCPAIFPKQVGDRNGKPICTAHLPAKIRLEKCTTRNSPGQQWAAKYCIWNKQHYWHARPLSRPMKCPAGTPVKLSEWNNKAVCKGAIARKIKAKKCDGSRKTISDTDYCVWDRGSFYKARKIK